MNQNDLRVIKTRKNIENSFMKLLRVKEFQKITVQDILDEALINRSTFYKHYEDKYQLATSLCRQMYDLFCSCVEDRFMQTESEDIFQSLTVLYQKLFVQREQILTLFQIHTDTIHLMSDMEHYLKTCFLKNKGCVKGKVDRMMDYQSTLYASIGMTTIRWCLEHDGYDLLLSHKDLFPKYLNLFKEK